MYRVIIILISLVGLSFHSPAQNVTHYLADHPEYPKYLEGKILADITYPGQDFRRLDEFGDPVRRTQGRKNGNRTWTYTYEGFELQFIDLYGEPELFRLWIHKSPPEFLFQGERLVVDRAMAVVMANSDFKQIEKDLNPSEKYRDGFQVLEVLVGQAGEILEIIYLRDPKY